MTTPRIAAIYARVSTDEQAEKGNSLEDQVKRLADYATANSLVVPPEYIFREDYTGATLERPEYTKVRELIRQRKIAVLLVKSGDRLARERVTAIRAREQIKAYGIELHYLTGRQDLSIRGEAILGTLDNFDELERLSIKERTVMGRERKARNGYLPGTARPQYGYRMAGDTRKLSFAVVDEQATIVRLIFEWFVKDRLGANEIARRLNERGIPSPGDRPGVHNKVRDGWAKHAVYRILRHECYAGLYWTHKRTRIDGKIIRKPHTDAIAVDVPAIVDRDVWEQAQAMMDAGRQQSKRNTKHQYLMARRMVCACGKSVSAGTFYKSNKTPQSYYMCTSPRCATGRCGMPHFRVDRVDATAWAFCQELLLHPEDLIGEYEAERNRQRDQHATIYEDIAVLERKIEQAQGRLSRILDRLDETQDPDEQAHYELRRVEMRSLLGELRNEHDRLRRIVAQDAIAPDALHSAEDLRDSYGDSVGDPRLPFAARRAIVEALGVRAIIRINAEGRKALTLLWHGVPYHRVLIEKASS